MRPLAAYWQASDIVTHFVEAAIDDGLSVYSHYAAEGLPCAGMALDDDALVQWLVDERMDEAVCAYAPMGPTRLRLRAYKADPGLQGHQFAHADAGLRPISMASRQSRFFQLGKRIPEFLDIMRGEQ